MLVIADDLTGATDAGGAFAAAGLRCVVSLNSGRLVTQGVGDGQANTHVFVVDTDSRDMTEAAARATTRDVIRRHSSRELFVKIDSTLRGHVRSTVESAVAALPHPPQRIVVCPAFPANGRTVINGGVFVHGVQLEGPTLFEIFDRFTPTVVVEIPDIKTDADLARIVASTPAATLWVGSAGLAYHLGQSLAVQLGEGQARHNASRRTPLAQRVVVVAGSLHPQTAQQLRQLAPGTNAIILDPLDPSFGDQVERHVRHADGLVLTGGATARAVLEILGVETLEVSGEIEPGVPWAVGAGRFGEIAIVTKAGGFGDTLTLQRAVQFLTRP